MARQGPAVAGPARSDGGSRAPRVVAALAALATLAGCAAVRPPGPPGPPPRTGEPPPVISAFGVWRDAAGGRLRRHAGIDIRAPVGSPVLAAADGVVLRVGREGRAGRFVVVAHTPDLATMYLHLAEVAVVPGQAVRRGQMLGRSGASGNATTPHLHFAVCRRPGGRCGPGLEAGWEDPAHHWVEGDPCFAPGRAYPVPPVRLSYPVACGD